MILYASFYASFTSWENLIFVNWYIADDEQINMENMDGLGVFFLILIPASIFFIFITTRSPDNNEESDAKNLE